MRHRTAGAWFPAVLGTQRGAAAVPDWAKIFTLILGLLGWSATIAATLLQGKIPDIGTLGIPAALILALAPPIRIGRNRADPGNDEAADESEAP